MKIKTLLHIQKLLKQDVDAKKELLKNEKRALKACQADVDSTEDELIIRFESIYNAEEEYEKAKSVYKDFTENDWR